MARECGPMEIVLASGFSSEERPLRLTDPDLRFEEEGVACVDAADVLPSGWEMRGRVSIEATLINGEEIELRMPEIGDWSELGASIPDALQRFGTGLVLLRGDFNLLGSENLLNRKFESDLAVLNRVIVPSSVPPTSPVTA